MSTIERFKKHNDEATKRINLAIQELGAETVGLDSAAGARKEALDNLAGALQSIAYAHDVALELDPSETPQSRLISATMDDLNHALSNSRKCLSELIRHVGPELTKLTCGMERMTEPEHELPGAGLSSYVTALEVVARAMTHIEDAQYQAAGFVEKLSPIDIDDSDNREAAQ